MDCQRDNIIFPSADIVTDYDAIFKKMVDYVRSLGLIVNTTTKARGHQGFYLKNRIDISSVIDSERKIEVLIHEFTHYIHSQIDPDITRTHGELENLFPDSDLKKVEQELYSVTQFFDKNKGFKLLQEKKTVITSEIKELSAKIKQIYPDFKRSEPYKKLEKLIRKTDAKYLLKYDKVRIKTAFWSETKDYSVATIDSDFPVLDFYAKEYIRLKSKQRTLKRITSRINRINKYYKRPTELFARFIEALFVDTNKVTQIAPYTYNLFCDGLKEGKYLELADFINNFF